MRLKHIFARHDWHQWFLPALTLVVLGMLMWPCLDRQLVGFISDDGIYMLSAQSLSQGLGMQMPHIPTMPVQTRYPFGYPLLLAPLWWLFPQSPGNMGAFSGYTLLWSLLGLWLTDRVMWRIFQWPVWARLLLLVSMGLNFFFLYYATTVMSEGPYLAFSMAALLAAWHWHQHPDSPTGKRWFVALVALSVACFHLRVLGITLIGAVTVWLVLLRRYRCALGYAGVCLLTTVLPWGMHIAAHRPARFTQDNIVLYGAICDYLSVLKLEVFSEPAKMWGAYLARLHTCMADLMLSLVVVLFPFLTGYITRPEVKSWFEQWPLLLTLQDGLILLAIFGIALRLLLPAVRYLPRWAQAAEGAQKMPWLMGLYLGLQMLMMTLWAYPSQSFRFLTVMIPVIWGLFLGGWIKTRPRLAGLLLVLACAWCWPEYATVLDVRQNNLLAHRSDLRPYWSELSGAYDFINRQLPQDAVIGAGRDMPLYLHTHRKTFHLFRDSLLPGNPIPQALHQLEVLMDQYHVSYVMLDLNVVNYKLDKVPVNPVVNDLVVGSPRRYKVVYTSPQRMVTLLARKPLGQQFDEPTHLFVAPPPPANQHPKQQGQVTP
jgi:hypothetical protein